MDKSIIKLSFARCKTLSSFCNDVAKGLLLGTFANQLAGEASIIPRTMISLIVLLFTSVFLYFALLFSKDNLYDY